MREAIEKRISRRTYKSVPISGEKVAALTEKIKELNEVSGLTMEFIDDATEAFASRTKTYGMFSGVRSVIVLKGKKSDPLLAEKIGYYGEELVLTATDLNLGTCWVGGTFDRGKFSVPDGERILCVVPVGEVKSEPTGKERFLRNSFALNRKSGEKRMTGYDKAPQWAKDAMEAVRLAPSAKNSQKPTFHYENGTVTADVEGYKDGAEGIELMYIVDLGIAKKHFEIEAGGRFEFGQGAAFIKE